MYTKEQLMAHLAQMGVDPKGTLLVHSSMKAIGAVEGGADTVLDALEEYMKDGLLVLPTHTWAQMNVDTYNVFDVRTEPACVGILPNLFMKRSGVKRSLHPTHSVAAAGREAKAFVDGEENSHSPCPKGGCWWKFYDRAAQVLMLGCGLDKYTFLHGVEEWHDIPNRIRTESQMFYCIDENGVRHETPQYRHCNSPSRYYPKMEGVFAKRGALTYGHFGDAKCLLVDAVKSAQITGEYLEKNPDLFGDDKPLEE